MKVLYTGLEGQLPDWLWILVPVGKAYGAGIDIFVDRLVIAGGWDIRNTISHRPPSLSHGIFSWYPSFPATQGRCGTSGQLYLFNYTLMRYWTHDPVVSLGRQPSALATAFGAPTQWEWDNEKGFLLLLQLSWFLMSHTSSALSVMEVFEQLLEIRVYLGDPSQLHDLKCHLYSNIGLVVVFVINPKLLSCLGLAAQCHSTV